MAEAALLDVAGVVASLGYNLVGNSLGMTGWVDTDLLSVDPRLGPLQDNGTGSVAKKYRCRSVILVEYL